jgi:hypothetical protein
MKARIIRHAGVLGLAAISFVSPYDVPKALLTSVSAFVIASVWLWLWLLCCRRVLTHRLAVDAAAAGSSVAELPRSSAHSGSRHVHG